LFIYIRHHRQHDVCRDKQRENGDGQTSQQLLETKFMRHGTRLDEINRADIPGMEFKTNTTSRK